MLRSAILALILLSCGRPQGFTIKKITPKSTSSWSNYGDVNKAKAILENQFHYLGSGSHTYAFANNDYVIKFYKQKRLDKETEFTSGKLALEKIPQETGLIYLHFSNSHDLGTTYFVDQHGNDFSLDMNRQEFLVQRRAKLGFIELEKFIDQDEEEKAFVALSDLFSIIRKRAHNNLSDRDLQIFKNFGFIGTQSLEIDIGNLKEDNAAIDSLLYQLENVEGQLRRWVHQKYPHLKEKLETFIQKEHRVA